MKAFISIVILVAVFVGVYKIWEYWDQVSRQKGTNAVEQTEEIDSSQLPGLPPQLERSLAEVTKQGPKSLKRWIDYNRRLIKDPRLAAIELDYVLLISGQDPVEAKRVFAEVKNRIDSESPLYKKVQALAATYN